MLFSKQISSFVAGALVTMSLGLGVAGVSATPAFAATTANNKSSVGRMVTKKNGWYDTGTGREVAVKDELQTGNYKVGKKTYKYRVRCIYKMQKQQVYYQNNKKTKTRWVADKNAVEPWRYFAKKPTGLTTDKWMNLLSSNSSTMTIPRNSSTMTMVNIPNKK